MIRCNLSILLAERGLTISQVSEDTGISRTTLTALAKNRNSGIQLETINTLCLYLKIEPSQLIAFLPFDIIFDGTSKNKDSFSVLAKHIKNGIVTPFKINLEFIENNINKKVQVLLTMPQIPDSIAEDIKNMPQPFLSDLGATVNSYATNINLDSDRFEPEQIESIPNK